MHQPSIKTVTTDIGTVTYLNSGDWVENLTALEYNEGMWRLHHYVKEPETEQEKQEQELEEKEHSSMLNPDELFYQIISK